MYSKFDIKKEKDLIILNYYILTNLEGTKFNKSIREIAEDLDINKNRAQKLMLQLQEKGIVKKLNSTCKSKGTYLYENKQEVWTEYGTDFSTDNSCKNDRSNGFLETDFGTDLNKNKDNKINKYKDVITEVFDDVNKVQIDSILEIQDLETIELDLFKSILKESALRATRNPISYAHTMIMNTIKDNITTLKDREITQKQRIEDNDRSNSESNKKWDYIDNSENDDFEMLATLTRKR